MLTQIKNIKNKNSNKSLKIGILGFGLVGKSVANYFSKLFKNSKLNLDLEIFDKRELTDQEKLGFKQAKDISNFLNSQDIIIPSPGFDLSNYQNFKSKFKSELSLFSQNWHKKSIAVTGSLGKTSLVQAINSALEQNNIKTHVGGNIGFPLLDLLDIQKELDQTVLELSSFQLELEHKLAPSIAILTNIYPNHIDRHKTIENYIEAKASIFKYQTKNDISIMPINLASTIRKYLNTQNRSLILFLEKPIDLGPKINFNNSKDLFIKDSLSNLSSNNLSINNLSINNIADNKINYKFYLALKDKLEDIILSSNLGLNRSDIIYFVFNNMLYKYMHKNFDTNIGKFDNIIKSDIIDDSKIIKETNISFEIINTELAINNNVFENLHNTNKIILNIVLDLLKLKQPNNRLEIPPHRCELIFKNKYLEFYDDSKSTVIEATFGALDKLAELNNKEIILFLGGTSKGVDRESKLNRFENYKIKKIFCFGQEAESLAKACPKKNCAEFYKSLDDAFSSLIEYLNSDPSNSTNLDNQNLDFAAKPTGKNLCVLFSPGGASYDLFKDYQERGERFKQLVTGTFDSI